MNTPSIKNLRDAITTAKRQLKAAESNLDFHAAAIISERIGRNQKALLERINQNK
jgi:hypothetical protein